MDVESKRPASPGVCFGPPLDASRLVAPIPRTSKKYGFPIFGFEQQTVGLRPKAWPLDKLCINSQTGSRNKKYYQPTPAPFVPTYNPKQTRARKLLPGPLAI